MSAYIMPTWLVVGITTFCVLVFVVFLLAVYASLMRRPITGTISYRIGRPINVASDPVRGPSSSPDGERTDGEASTQGSMPFPDHSLP